VVVCNVRRFIIKGNIKVCGGRSERWTRCATKGAAQWERSTWDLQSRPPHRVAPPQAEQAGYGSETAPRPGAFHAPRQCHDDPGQARVGHIRSGQVRSAGPLLSDSEAEPVGKNNNKGRSPQKAQNSNRRRRSRPPQLEVKNTRLS
jgi:hypothetical protein